MRREAMLARLRDEVRRVEGATADAHATLPFGVPAIDAHLGGGLPLGQLHEAMGGGSDAGFAAAATLFVAGLLARVPGQVLWCLTSRDLFAPALAGVGLTPDRVIYAEARRDADVLAAMEEGLRHGGLAGVVGEVAKLPLTAARRLHLAAGGSGVTALALRRWRRADAGVEPGAAATRWRVTPAPSTPLPVEGIGRARWTLDLVRCRGADAASWLVEGCDEAGRLALAADVAHRPPAPPRIGEATGIGRRAA